MTSKGGDSDAYNSTLHVLERARRGDRSAAQILLERALPSLRKWSRGRLPGYARAGFDTEDVVHDAVVNTQKRQARFDHRTVAPDVPRTRSRPAWAASA
jgi:DNA-directed RNA polymerase specialized sigma24 family protein